MEGGRTARFLRATADYSQDKFPVPMAMDGKPDTGWAWGGQPGRHHTAVFELAEPLTMDEAPMDLKISLSQQYGSAHHIGRFRLSVTASEPSFDVLTDSIRGIIATAPLARSEEQRAALIDYFRPLSKYFATTTCTAR